jgi:hypothetical protein
MLCCAVGLTGGRYLDWDSGVILSMEISELIFE